MKALSVLIHKTIIPKQKKTLTRSKTLLARKITADIILSIKDYIAGKKPDNLDCFMGEDTENITFLSGVRFGPHDWPFELDMTDEDTVHAYPDGAGYLYIDFKIITTERFKKATEFNLSATAGVDYENFANIMLYLEVDRKISNKSLKQIYIELRETIKHEITHLSQESPLRLINDCRDFRTYHQPGSFEYFSDDFEVEAYVEGLYDRSKINKTTIDKEIEEYLETQIAPRGIITEEEAEQIYKKWNSWAKKRYSHAKF